MNIFSHIFLPVVLLICAFPNNIFSQTLNITDSVSLNWTRLDGPPAFVSKYAEGGGKMYAASEEMLFTSSDGGLHWEPNLALGRKRIVQIFANDYTVLVIANEPRVLDPTLPFSVVELHQVFRSSNGGLSWEQVLGLFLEPETYYQNRPDQMFAANDSTIVFNYDYWIPLSFQLIKQLWVTRDFGVTWSQPLTQASHFHASHDTFSYIKLINGSPFGMVSDHANLNQTQQVDLTEAGIAVNDLLKAVFKNGVFHLFAKDKSISTSADFGMTWSSHTLTFPGTLEGIEWADSVFYAKSSTGVYRVESAPPFNYSAVYAGEMGRFPKPATVSPTISGLWVNTDTYQTVFSNDNGSNWAPRSKGMSSRVGHMTGICERLFARSLGLPNLPGGWYTSEANDQIWDLVTESAFYNYSDYPSLFLGEFDGYAYRYIPAAVQRSADCGESWQNLPVGVTAAPKGIFKHKGRLILYTALDYKLLYSYDDGMTWAWGALPNTGVISLLDKGNTLIAFYPDKMLRSENSGDTWEELILPNSMRAIFAVGQDLVAYHFTSSYGALAVYRSSDLGASWEITTDLPSLQFGGPRILTHKRELLFMHHNDALYLSANGGQSWARADDLPFTKRVFKNGTFYSHETLVPQASHYFAHNGMVYATTEADGLWATPADSILHLLLGSSSLEEPAVDLTTWKLSPNPASTEIWVSRAQDFDAFGYNIHVRVIDPLGRVYGSNDIFSLPKEGFKIDLLGLPCGVYFLEILEKNRKTTKRFLKI